MISVGHNSLSVLVRSVLTRFILLILFFMQSGTLFSAQLSSSGSRAIFTTSFNEFAVCVEQYTYGCSGGIKANVSKNSSVRVSSTPYPSVNRKLTVDVATPTDNSDHPFAYTAISLNDVKPGDQLLLSTWVRTTDFRGDSFIAVMGDTDSNVGFIDQLEQSNSVFGPSGHAAWMKISVKHQVTEDESTVRFAFGARSNFTDCPSSSCGQVHFDNVLVQRIDPTQKSVDTVAFSNVCNFTQFVQVENNSCANLDKQFGYVAAQIDRPTRHIPCQELSATKINSVIAEIRPTGGEIVLAPCVVLLNDDIELVSNVTITGAGVGRTILMRDPGWDNKASTLIRIRGDKSAHVRNIVLQDFTVQGSGPLATSMNNIQLRYADNVLVQRIETKSAGKSGISIRSSQNITVRYVTAHSSVRFHGIESKDCYMHPSADINADGQVSRTECSYGIPQFYTEHISIHSNYAFNNGDYGIDSHASYAEFAGNSLNDNSGASKFPEPANNVWIHGNVFSRSIRDGMKISLQLKMGGDSLVPHRHAIYKNYFLKNRMYGIRIFDRAREIVLNDNIFENNGFANTMWLLRGSNAMPRVYLCESSSVKLHGIRGSVKALKILSNDNGLCNLDDVSTVFDRL